MKKLLSLLCIATLYFQPLSAEIFELALEVKTLHCPQCADDLQQRIEAIPGVQNATVIEEKSIVLINWDKEHYLQGEAFSKSLQDSLFAFQSLELDFSAKIEKKGDVLTLTSEPDGTIFFIKDKKNIKLLAKHVEGDSVHLLASITHPEKGSNLLEIREVIEE